MVVVVDFSQIACVVVPPDISILILDLYRTYYLGSPIHSSEEEVGVDDRHMVIFDSLSGWCPIGVQVDRIQTFSVRLGQILVQNLANVIA